MINRKIISTLSRLEREFPVVTITGPRQSGKTTIAKTYFENHEYISLENPRNLRLAQLDPEAFLSLHSGPTIFDEAQRCSELFSYLQEIVDSHNTPGKYVLTGSQNFLLMKTITQSLAGRAGVTYLLPLELDELLASGKNTTSTACRAQTTRETQAEHDAQIAPASETPPTPDAQPATLNTIEDAIFKGFYPRVFDKNIKPHDFYLSYLRTYLERDVTDELGVRKTTDFRNFLTLCATRVGNILETSNLANSVGVSSATVKNWLSLLETSFILFRLQPYYKNFGKRVIKSPKLFFIDTGLACHLLKVKSGLQILESEDLRGKLFENFVIAEILKKYYNRGLEPNIYFWRDSNGREIDLLIESGGKIKYAVEIKSSVTMNLDAFKSLSVIGKEMGLSKDKRIVVYQGKQPLQTKFGRFMTIEELDELVC